MKKPEQTKRTSPLLKRPARFIWLTFLALSALFAISLPFQDDPLSPRVWPLALAYCALLPAFSAGIALAQLGRKMHILLAALALLAYSPGIFGFVLVLEGASRLADAFLWFRISFFLLCALGLTALVLSVRGWLLYWKQRHEPT
jgi:hypothetical protein